MTTYAANQAGCLAGHGVAEARPARAAAEISPGTRRQPVPERLMSALIACTTVLAGLCLGMSVVALLFRVAQRAAGFLE